MRHVRPDHALQRIRSRSGGPPALLALLAVVATLCSDAAELPFEADGRRADPKELSVQIIGRTNLVGTLKIERWKTTERIIELYDEGFGGRRESVRTNNANTFFLVTKTLNGITNPPIILLDVNTNYQEGTRVRVAGVLSAARWKTNTTYHLNVETIREAPAPPETESGAGVLVTNLALQKGIKLTNFQQPRVSFDAARREWRFFYTLLPPGRPGGHFVITVDEAGKTQFMPGR